MGQNARSRGVYHARISVDVLLLAMAVALTLFCIGAFIRIGPDPQATPNQNGLLALQPGDELLAFEDFSFGAENWSHPTTSDQIGGLGPVLGPFTNERVTRTIEVPEGARDLQVIFDVHLHGEWNLADGLTVALGGERLLDLTIAGVSEDHLALDIAIAETSDMDVHVEQTSIPVRPDVSAVAEDDDTAILNLRMTFSGPPAAGMMTLGVSAQSSNDALWTLDNLAIVASGGSDDA